MIKAAIFDVGGVLHSNRLFSPGDFTHAHFDLTEEEFRDHYVNKEVIALVRSLKDKDVKLAALSNTIEEHAMYLATMGMYDEFDELIFSYKVEVRKPDPKIFQIAIEKIGIEYNEAIFVDDLQENVDIAITLGMHGILFTTAEALEKEVNALKI